jgi:hypothetical protein
MKQPGKTNTPRVCLSFWRLGITLMAVAWATVGMAQSPMQVQSDTSERRVTIMALRPREALSGSVQNSSWKRPAR